MAEGEWAESIARWQQVLDQFGSASSWSAHRGLIVANMKMGETEAAEAAATRAQASFPDSVELAVAQAEIPMTDERWQVAASRWERLLERFGPSVPPRAYAQLAIAYGKLGDVGAASAALNLGRDRNPDSAYLTGNSAELAMAQRDWPEAIRRWNELLQARAADAERPPVGSRFPRRGSQWGWYEEAWQTIARDWVDVEARVGFTPSPSLYCALGRTLDNARLPNECLEMLRIGRAAHPDDDQLAFDYAVARLGLIRPGQRSSELLSLRQELAGHPLVAGFCNDGPLAAPREPLPSPSHARGGVDPVPEVRAANAGTLAAFAPGSSHVTGELGRILIIRVPHGSSVELELKAGRYLSRDGIERRVREISERDAWEEMTAPDNRLFARAREVADTFGRRFATPPNLEAGDLADAMLFFLVHELALYDPMTRLAADVANESDGSPVFIETPTDDYAYLDGYPFSHFDVLYLYFALRERGVNAFLCRYYRGTAPIPSSITFMPGVRSLLPNTEIEAATVDRYASALVPAGIRSVRRVAASLNSPLVFSAGEVIREPDDDLAPLEDITIEPAASIHPESSTLPTFSFGLREASTLRSLPLGGGDDLGVPARIEASEPLGDDWLLWLDRALHSYLAEIAANSNAEIATRGIEEAHVADHLFADASLFAAAVKRSGGRVVLWPHSANPVHVNERRSGTFDEVHAVTRAGCEQWRHRFPDVRVIHSPSTMLDPPVRDGRVDPAMPLSVVVFGGRSVYRHMPMLNQSLHEASYRAFFSGLEILQEQYPIKVYFKPRGRTGEEEMWLSSVVGTSASWRSVFEPPKRLDLSNMLFVSISMGSSALLEGLGRGIPGVVVRDFPARDYTTLDERAIPTGPSESVLNIAASCCEPGGYERLLRSELAYYATELTTGDPL